MDINDLLSTDLKTERGNLSGGLPNYYRVVPVLFFATVIGSIALIVHFSMQIRSLSFERDQEMARLNDQVMVTEGLNADKFEIEQENVRADAIAKWVETAQGLQPLIAGLARTIENDASVDTLSLKRNPELPAQLFLVLRLNGDVQEQLDQSMQAVRGLNYRSFSASQEQGDGILDYDATLIWNGK